MALNQLNEFQCEDVMIWTGQLQVADGFGSLKVGHAVHRFCSCMENFHLLFFCAEEADCRYCTLSVPFSTLRNESLRTSYLDSAT